MASEARTEGRLDDLTHKVDTGFAEVGEDLREVRREPGSSNRTIHQFMFAIVGSLLLGFSGMTAALIALA